MRNDGRESVNSIRRPKISIGWLGRANGSCRMTNWSGTDVAAGVYIGKVSGNREMVENPDGCSARCVFSNVAMDKVSNKSYEEFICSIVSLAILGNNTLRVSGGDSSNLLGNMLAGCRVTVHLSVISCSGGSLMSICVNAVMLALMNAGIPLARLFVAVSFSYFVKNESLEVLLDPTKEEEEETNENNIHHNCCLVYDTTMIEKEDNDKYILFSVDSLGKKEYVEECVSKGKNAGKRILKIMKESIAETAKM